MILSVAPTIDLAALPAPNVIEPLDYEQRLAARMASLKARFVAGGVAYDVGTLDSDPAEILQQEDCFRELVDRARINDAVRAVLPAYARGADLDAIALRAGVTRLTLAPADGDTPAVMEGDAKLLQRYLAAFGRPAAGSIDGYVYAALTAVPALHDIAVLGPATHGRPGRAEIVLLAPIGEEVTPAWIEAVRDAAGEEDVRPLTDVVVVLAAEVVTYDVSAVIEVPIGPDPNVVKAAAEASLATYASTRFRIGGDQGRIPANALAAALYVPNVSRVVMPPIGDLVLTPYQAPRIGAVDVAAEVVG